MSAVEMSAAEVRTLNDARRVLGECARAVRTSPDADTAFARAHAEVAAHALFTFLNVLNSYCHVPLTREQLHTDCYPPEMVNA